MTSTIRDQDTALLCGASDAPQVGHFYLDMSKGDLYCLNEAARRMRASGAPLLAGDPAIADLRTATGAVVAGDALPAAIAARDGRLAEAEYVLARPGQPQRLLQHSATPLKDADGRVRAVLASVVCRPQPPDWSTIAGLAHDLRTPLQTLNMVGHILEVRTLPEAQRAEALQRLGNAAERAQQIAQELLEWCRTHGGSARGPQLEWFALEPLLRDMVAEQAAAARQKQLALGATLAPIRGWQMFSDAGRLARIMANLLVNAVRYTPAGSGHVDLAAAWEEQAGARVLVVQVHDTGAGIAAHEQESIFRPFERGQTGHDQEATGSGIGLSVVDRLSQQLGLRCDVQSVAGQGSQFRVSVPQHLLRMAPVAAVPV